MLRARPARLLNCRRLPVALWLFAGWLALVPLAARPLHAAEPNKIAASLEFVPANVAFYSATLRGAEQVDIVRRSKAWARFMALPAVKSAWDQFDSQWSKDDGSLAMARQLLSLPENQQLLAVLGEMFSDEVFVYGDEQTVVTLDLFQRLFNTVRFANLGRSLAKARGDNDTEDDPLDTARALLDVVDEDHEALQMPNLVFGFKVKDRKAAETQLKRLEIMAALVLSQNPELKERFARKKIGDTEYLTLSLDGSMVPWDEVPLSTLAEEPGQYDDLVASLKEITLVIHLGLRGDFLLLSLGRSDKHLAALGSGDLLADEDELEPLAKYADRRLTNINFLGEDLVSLLVGNPDDLDQLSEVAEQLLSGLEVDEELQKTIVDDVAALAADLKPLVPEPGPIVGFSFLTPRGIESYTYNWSQNLNLDAAQPLSLLDHLGGAPLAAVAARSKVSPQQYDLLAKWVEKAYGYVDKLAVPQLKEDDREQYKKVMAVLTPLAVRWNKTTKEKLLPALADGQTALVFDAKLTSKHWFAAWPETPGNMPMAELAIVLGVSDAEKLQQAMADYLDILDAGIAGIRALNPQAVPEFKIPRPEAQVTADGQLFTYALPKELGVDSQIAPNAGLSKTTAVLSLSPKHSLRILGSHPLPAEGSPLDKKQPLAVAVYLDWAGLVDAVTPWIDLGLQSYGDQVVEAVPGALGEEVDTKKDAKKILIDEVHDVLAILKTLRSVVSTTERDSHAEAMVSHTEIHFQDLP